MDEPFSNRWCRQVNRHISESASTAAAAAVESLDTSDDARVEILVRLRRPGAGAGEIRGTATVTPRAAPYVVLGTYQPDAKFDVVIELPVQVLHRISGKAVVDCGTDPWIPAMLKVHKGMDVILEMFYRHGHSSPIRGGTIPQLV